LSIIINKFIGIFPLKAKTFPFSIVPRKAVFMRYIEKKRVRKMAGNIFLKNKTAKMFEI